MNYTKAGLHHLGQLKPLGSYVKFSLGVHLVVFTAFFLWQREGGQTRRSYNLNLVKSSVRVDVVAMPRLTFSELKALEKLPPLPDQEEEQGEKAKESSSPPREGDFLKVKEGKKKVPDFREMMKKMAQKKTKTELRPVSSRKSKKKNSRKKKKNNNKVVSKKLKKKLEQLAFVGNKLSKGAALTGTLSGQAAQELALYMNSLPDKVRPYWKLPSFLKDKNLRCRIRIFLRGNGDLIKAQIIEGSGDSEYDQRALKAVRATPFPPLDPAFEDQGVKGKIILGFPL